MRCVMEYNIKNNIQNQMICIKLTKQIIKIKWNKKKGNKIKIFQKSKMHYKKSTLRCCNVRTSRYLRVLVPRLIPPHSDWDRRILKMGKLKMKMVKIMKTLFEWELEQENYQFDSNKNYKYYFTSNKNIKQWEKWNIKNNK